MAKISANGATEMARIKTTSPTGTTYIWVVTSDGRVLSRVTDYGGSGYTIYYRHWPHDKTQAALTTLAESLGHKVIPA